MRRETRLLPDLGGTTATAPYHVWTVQTHCGAPLDMTFKPLQRGVYSAHTRLMMTLINTNAHNVSRLLFDRQINCRATTGTFLHSNVRVGGGRLDFGFCCLLWLHYSSRLVTRTLLRRGLLAAAGTVGVLYTY
jgi:hypothetical protein